MAITFTEAKAILDEIAARSESNRKLLLQAKARINQAVADLTSMQTDYATFVADLNAAAVANPADTAWQTAKAEKDQMASDFMALKTTAEQQKAAIEAL